MAIYDVEGNEIPVDPTAARIAAVGRLMETTAVSDCPRIGDEVAKLLAAIRRTITAPKGQLLVLPGGRVGQLKAPTSD